MQRRRTHKTLARKGFAQRSLKFGAFILGAVSVAAAIVALAALPVYLSITQNLPSIDRLQELLDPVDGELLQSTELMDRSGQELLFRVEPQDAPRTFVNAVENPYVVAAFIASQEPNFWRADHSWSLVPTPQGIAEKVIARLLLADEPDGWPKTIRTRLLAAEAIKSYGRGQVLNWALNSAYFGHRTFGIESAARLFFGKGTGELSLGEAALLAAVAQAPALNPFDAPELAIAYQELVLSAMRDQGVISQSEYEQALLTPMTFAPEPESDTSSLDDSVLAELETHLGADRVQQGNLDVVTSIDAALQRELSGLVDGQSIGAVILDPLNGHILAMSENALSEQYSVVDVTLPLAYLDVFAQGNSPASLVWLRGNPTTMRVALASGQAPDGNLTINEKVAQGLGFRADDDGYSATVLDVARAYGSLINGYLSAHTDVGASLLLFASDSEGNVLLNNTQPTRDAIASAELAYLVTDVLSDSSLRREISSLPTGRPLAYFATGNWAVGYSPQRVIVVRSEDGEEATNVWVKLFEAAHSDLPVKNWEIPANLNSVVVCVPSGLLPGEDCPETRRDWFLGGTEPSQTDSLFQRVAINTLNGTLATVFTPQEFVDERVYLVAPDGVRTAIEQPPEDYDTIPAFAGQNSPITIASPALFAVVNGLVRISGILDASATNYDVQVGQGLWPTEWSLVAEGRAPFNRRISVDWDTTGLSGIWAIQLQAWNSDGVLVRTYTVVTIGD